MAAYYVFVFFLFGTIFGSFYNVVGDRLTRNESIVKPRSHCPKCNHVLTPLELIPIVSYIIQGGKCKNCKKNIPLFHPLFEFTSGILFALCFLIFRFTPELIIALTFVSMLLILFVSDIEAMIIPDEIIGIFGLSLLVEIFLIRGINAGFYSIRDGFFAMLTMFLLKKFGDFLFKKESMGGGDIKLLFIFGMVIGFPMAILAVFLGSFIGLPIAIMILKMTKDHEIPFGPFLSIGALLLYFSRIDFNTFIQLLYK